MRLLSVFLCCFLLFTGCSGKNKSVSDASVLESAEEIYQDAMDKMQDQRYSKAISLFEDLERTYPYSKLAAKSQIMAAYANYKAEEYAKALVAVEQFIKFHPGHADIAYAYYLKALCYYEQISSIKKDQGYAARSKDALTEIIARFPESDYARDAQIKLDLVMDRLAGKEIEIGRFYLKKHKYIAAINRFKVVVDDYDTTSHVAEGLYRMVESYLSLGVKDEAKKYAAVLGYNYPGSKWYNKAYKLLKGDLPKVVDGNININKDGSFFQFKIPFLGKKEQKD